MEYNWNILSALSRSALWLTFLVIPGSHLSAQTGDPTDEMIRRFTNRPTLAPSDSQSVASELRSLARTSNLKNNSGLSTDLVDPQFLNSSLDDGDGDGIPDGWLQRGSPVVLSENENDFIRINSVDRFTQTWVRSIGDQHITFINRVRGELGFERPVLDTFQRTGNVDFFERSRGSLSSTEWQTFFYSTDLISNPLPQLMTFPGGSDLNNWVDIDDFAILDTTFFNGDFEGDGVTQADYGFPVREWFLNGSTIESTNDFSSTQTRVLRIPPGGKAVQVVSALEGNHSYFLDFDSRSLGSGLESGLTITEEYLDLEGDVLTTATWPSVSPTSLVQQQTLSLPGVGRLLVEASRVTIENTGTETIEIDNISRGYVLMTPTPFNPAVDVYEEELKVLVVWPRHDFLTSIEIRDDEENIDFNANGSTDNGSLWFEYDPPETIEPGIRSVELEIVNNDPLSSDTARTIQLSHSFEITEPVELQFPVQQTSDRFERIAWTWLLTVGASEEEIRPLLEQVLADNYTLAFVFADGDQWPIVGRICDEIGLPFVAGDFNVQLAVKGSPAANEVLSYQSYVEFVRAELAGALESDSIAGIYVVDEPFGFNQGLQAERFNRFVASTPDFPQPWFIIQPVTNDVSVIERLRPTAYLTDHYPTNESAADLQQNLMTLSDLVVTDMAFADQNNLPYYLVAQSFTLPEFQVLGPRSMISATVGTVLVAATDGIGTFTHFTINTLSGVRDIDGKIVGNGQEWIEQLERLDAIENELANREVINGPNNTGNFFWSITESDDGKKLLNVVSFTPRRESTARISFQNNNFDLVDLETGEHISISNFFTDIDFESGEWRIFEFSDPGVDATQVNVTSVITRGEQADFNLPALPLLNTGRTILDAVVNGDGDFFATGPQGITRITPELQASAVLDLAADHLFLDNQTLYGGTERFGLETFDLDSNQKSVQTIRRTGNVHDVVVNDGIVWNSLSYLGISAFDLNNNTEFIDHEFVATTAYDLELSPIADSVLVSDERSGVWLYELLSLPEQELQATFLAPLRRAFDLQLNSGANNLAVASLRDGVAFFDIVIVDEAGDLSLQLEQKYLDAPTGEKVRQVDWITDDLLVATEWDGDMLFFVVVDESVFYMGRDAAANRSSSMSQVIVSDGRIIQFFRDGSVYSFDAQPVIDAAENFQLSSSWVFF